MENAPEGGDGLQRGVTIVAQETKELIVLQSTGSNTPHTGHTPHKSFLCLNMHVDRA